jgi:creatinine amidohydrolase/Fe(II)-dependent formamide hydrolase-like protein
MMTDDATMWMRLCQPSIATDSRGGQGRLESMPPHVRVYWLEYAALYAYLRGVARSLILHGRRRMLCPNGHAGNGSIVAGVYATFEAASRAGNVRCAKTDWWGFSQPRVLNRVAAGGE